MFKSAQYQPEAESDLLTFFYLNNASAGRLQSFFIHDKTHKIFYRTSLTTTVT